MATAAALSASEFPTGSARVFVATGADFPDAMAGGPAAGRFANPILLVQKDAIPTATSAELDRLNPQTIVVLLLVRRDGIPDATRTELLRLDPQRIYVLGGTASVSGAVATALNAYTDGPVTRLGGSDRYGTGAAVARTFWKKARTYAASALNFADALTGGAAAGRAGVPIMLVAGTFVPLATGQEVLRLGPHRMTAIGGTAAVSNTAITRLQQLMGTP